MLDRPPHRVQVQRREPVRTAHGTSFEPVGDPITVRCIVRAVSASESNVDGLTAQTMRRIVARDWPGDIYSLVSWGGIVWQQQGDAQLFDGSIRTRHWEVLLRKADGDGAGL